MSGKTETRAEPGDDKSRRAALPPGTWVWLHNFARWLGSWIFLPPFRLRVRGRDRVPASGAVVVVANHSSMVDGPLVFGVLRRRRPVFLIKREMFKGFLRWALPRIGQLAVRRGEPDRVPLLAAVRVLSAGGVVGIFPEGGRGDGDVAKAEHGAAWLARSGNAVVLPIAVRGTRRSLTSDRRRRRRVDVLVGEPFRVSTERGRKGLSIATEQIRASLAELVRELDRRRAADPELTSASDSGPDSAAGFDPTGIADLDDGGVDDGGVDDGGAGDRGDVDTGGGEAESSGE
ncbi:MAG TPA: lysophospholipid acyltransferase family protein [Pseudonocardiaceae bacterium]